MPEWLKDLTAKPVAALRVLVGAWPTWGAALTAVLTAVATEVVPLLPAPTGVKVAAWVALALGVIASISKAVSQVTPIVYQDEAGLLPLPAAPALEYDPDRLRSYDPPEQPRQFPSDSERARRPHLYKDQPPSST